MNILIVENNVAQAESLKVVLDHAGYSPQVAHNVDTARALAHVHPPQLVILDLVLSGNGDGFLEWLRKQAGMESTPVIITTGLAGDDVEGLDKEPQVWLVHKPYEADGLIAMMKHLGVVPLHAHTT